jgi:hypothetical protein
MSAIVNINTPKSLKVSNEEYFNNFDCNATNEIKKYTNSLAYGLSYKSNPYNVAGKLINFKLIMDNYNKCKYVVRCNVKYEINQ